MKKLMIALTAVAAAFAAHAVTPIAGENFNGKTLDQLSGWTSLGDSDISSTAYSFGKSGTVGAPDPYRLDAAAENLAIKTPLTTPAYYSITQQSMAGVYFDSLVKFTACDTDAEVPAGSDAKIMVWTKEIVGANEVVTGTNLMVTAGYFSDITGSITSKTYDCGSLANYDVALDGNDWCRLTIKAVSDISSAADGVAGFVVFVNAKAATIAGTGEALKIGVAGSYADNLSATCQIWEKNHRLFPSMVAMNQNISSVGFAGQGAVDDVAFYTGEPTDVGGNEFAKDSSAFTFTWTPADVTAISYAVAGGTSTAVDNLSSGTQLIGVKGATTVAVNVTYAAGKMAGTWTAADGATISGSTFTTAANGGSGVIVAQNIGATFNGQNYATISAALEDVNKAAAGTYMLALGNACTDQIEINNTAEGFNLVIDLKGQNITVADTAAIYIEAGAVTITNSLTTGGIVDSTGTGEYAVFSDGAVMIQAGQYEDSVEIGTGSSITGGKFKVQPAASLAPEGYEFVKDGDYYVLAKATYVAQIGDKKYATIQAALNDVKTGYESASPDVITLLTSVTTTGANPTPGALIGYGTNVVIDLNGQTWTETSGYYALLTGASSRFAIRPRVAASRRRAMVRWC